MGACGDVTRNVVGCPLAGVDADELIDASPLVAETTALLNGHPAFYNLPRKFKVSIAGCRVVVRVSRDQRRRAHRASRHPRSGEVGFSLRVGGGLSTDPHLGAPPRRLRAAGAGAGRRARVAEVFRDSDVLREHREKARLKFLFLQHGWTEARFQEALERRLGYALAPGGRRRSSRTTASAIISASGRSGRPGRVLGRRPGGARPPHALAAARGGRRGRAHGSGRCARPRCRTSSCSTSPRAELAPSCARAGGGRAAARRLAVRARHRRVHGHRVLQARAHRDEGLRAAAGGGPRAAAARLRRAPHIHVTGCPNSCGQHWIADIGLEGKKLKVDGRLVDAYYFCIGGAAGGHAAIARPIGYRVPPFEVAPPSSAWSRPTSRERLPGERFRAFCGARTTSRAARAAGGRRDGGRRARSVARAVPHGVEG